MRNYYILMLLLTLFGCILIGVSMYLVGSPLAQKQIQLDQTRLNDFSIISSNITRFYSLHVRLPYTLQELGASAPDVSLLDPETRKPYAYNPNSNSSFSLCATFLTAITSNTQQQNTVPDNTPHPKGNYCVPYPQVQTTNIPTTRNYTVPFTSTTWQSTTSLPTPLYEATTQTHTTLNLGTFVYEMGGYNPVTNTTVNAVTYAKITPEGTVGEWNTTSPLPLGLRAANSVLYASGSATVMYVLGGEYNDTTPTFSDNMYVAHVLADGSVSTWLPTKSLPEKLYEASAVLYKNTIYVIGGWNGTASPRVYYATIQPDTTLSSWQKTSSLPIPLLGSGAVLAHAGNNNYLYVIGGTTNVYGNNNNISSVYYSKILADSTLSPWQQTESYPLAINEQVVDMYQRANQTFLVSLGGFIQSTWSDSVYTTGVNADGTLNPWVKSNVSLPRPLASTTSFLFSSFNGSEIIYTLGGGASSDTNGGIPNVYYAPIDTFLPMKD